MGKPKKETSNDNKTKTRSKEDEKTKEKKITAEDVLAMMPRTDKQKRHEKRIKAKERDERRQARKAKKMGEEAGQLQEFDVAPGAVRARAAASESESATNNDDYEYDDDELMKMEGISQEKKNKIMEARKLIKAGIGSIAGGAGNNGSNNKNQGPRDSQSSNNNNTERFEIVKGNASFMDTLPTKKDTRN